MLTRIAAPTVRCMQAYLDANVAVALPELARPSVKGKNHGWDSPKPLGGSLGRWHWCGDGRLEVRYSSYIRLVWEELATLVGFLLSFLDHPTGYSQSPNPSIAREP